MFVGLVNGIVLQFSLSEDMNRMERTRSFQGHTHTVTGVVYSPADDTLYICSRDKSLSWFSTDTGMKLGLNFIFEF